MHGASGNRVVPPPYLNLFFSLPLMDLLVAGCKNDFQLERGAVTFGIVAWTIWKRRNAEIFQGEDALEENPIRSLWHHIDRIIMAEDIFAMVHPDKRATTSINSWSRPEQGWIKLNSDGAKCRLTGSAAGGGLFRDSFGFWLGGYQLKSGHVPIITAELKAIKTELEIAWEKGYKKLLVETDSTEATSILNGLVVESETDLVQQIRAMLNDDWEVRIMQTIRINNGCADLLTKNAFQMGISFKILPFIPYFLNKVYCQYVMEIRCCSLFNYS
jgi:Reverse transcriptase-like